MDRRRTIRRLHRSLRDPANSDSIWQGRQITACACASGAARGSALAYGDISHGRIVEAHPTTAWRWVQAAVKRAEELGGIMPGKRIGTHILPDTQYIGRLFLTLRQISTRRFCRGSCLEWRCPRCASTLFVALKLHNQVHHFFLEFLIGSQFNPPYRVISTLLMDCHRVAYLQ